jgi:hypothetical protein
MYDFITSYFGHLENNGSLKYAYVSNIDTLHCAVSKITL